MVVRRLAESGFGFRLGITSAIHKVWLERLGLIFGWEIISFKRFSFVNFVEEVRILFFYFQFILC